MAQAAALAAIRDLFPEEEVAAVEKEETPVPASAPELSFGAKYKILFDRYKAEMDRLSAAQAELNALERKFNAGEDYWMAFRKPDQYKQAESEAKVAEQIRRLLVARAEERFAPDGGKLSIDHESLNELHPLSRRDASRYDVKLYCEFNPEACWDYLVETYGGDSGKKHAWAQAAETIIYEFGLRNNPEVKVVAGRSVLEVRAWTEEGFRGKRTLSYNASESIQKLFTALCGFAGWAEDTDLVEAIEAQRRAHGYHDPVELRQRYDLTKEVRYTTFKEKWQWAFGGRTAEQLNLFLSQYGTFDK